MPAFAFPRLAALGEEGLKLPYEVLVWLAHDVQRTEHPFKEP